MKSKRLLRMNENAMKNIMKLYKSECHKRLYVVCCSLKPFGMSNWLHQNVRWFRQRSQFLVRLLP